MILLQLYHLTQNQQTISDESEILILSGEYQVMLVSVAGSLCLSVSLSACNYLRNDQQIFKNFDIG